MENIISKEEFINIVNNNKSSDNYDFDFLYNVYELAYNSCFELLRQQFKVVKIDSDILISYVLGEYLYSAGLLNKEELSNFVKNENYMYTMGSVSADKYLSLSLFDHKELKLTSKYLPPISSINLYVNLMLNIITRYRRNDPKNTLIIDLLVKTLSIARSIIILLCEGYETEAFAMWRTLHECECTLILIHKYGDIAINAYLKHMQYGIAYKGEFKNNNENLILMNEVKEEMAKINLKSKDTKKFIEYGWLNAIPESKTIENFKLNFRDGLESLAGLHAKSEIYMNSSEILHSTPMLIYSNKNYYYFVTLLNLYESFFRIEEVFQPLFFATVEENGKNSYLEMKKLYYSQLLSIYKRELSNFNKGQK